MVRRDLAASFGGVKSFGRKVCSTSVSIPRGVKEASFFFFGFRGFNLVYIQFFARFERLHFK